MQLCDMQRSMKQGRGAPVGVDCARDARDAVRELGAEDDVGVVEHALLR